MSVFDTLVERGFVQQVTDEAAVRAALARAPEQPVVAYCGYDPTADSLHVGHLFPTMALLHLERAGHRPIVVLGGGTAMVGDPSGKTELRQMLTEEQIQGNLAHLREQFQHLLDIDGGKTLCVDNGTWILPLNYVHFLREVGRHFSVNRMLAAEAYKLRLERGLSFIEFNYQLLQAYDFLELYRRHRCTLQLGGDDQWGNILAGVDLVRRIEGATVHGLTFPLQLTATGEKMGKTAAGAVWLDPERLSPYDYYQYWINTHDDDVARMLGFFTFLPMAEVRAVAAQSGAELNLAKSILAFEATAIVHGRDAAEKAHRAAQAAFGGRNLPDTILPTSTVPRQSRAEVAEMPTTRLSAAELGEGVPVVELLVRTRLVDSKNEARRLIQQGAVRLEPGGAVSDVLARVFVAAFDAGAIVVRVGKKKAHRVLKG